MVRGGREVADFAVITVGAGVGYGLAIGNHVIRTADTGLGLGWALPAGSQRGRCVADGHRGCSTAMLSIPSICLQISAALGRPVDYAQALELADSGNQVAVAVLESAAKALGVLISAAANLTMVNTVVLGGEGAGPFHESGSHGSGGADSGARSRGRARDPAGDFSGFHPMGKRSRGRGHSSAGIRPLGCTCHGLAWQKRKEAATMPRIFSPRRSMHGRVSRFVMAALMLSVVAVVAGCAQQQPPGGTSATPTAAVTPATTEPSAAQSATGVDLTITLTESPQATPRTFRLVSSGSTPATESSLPDPAAALAAVEKHGEKIFFALPDPNRICTQQYGGPQIAVVTGWFHGREVEASFSRTDGCEISRWEALAPLFGALAGGTGAV